MLQRESKLEPLKNVDVLRKKGSITKLSPLARRRSNHFDLEYHIILTMPKYKWNRNIITSVPLGLEHPGICAFLLCAHSCLFVELHLAEYDDAHGFAVAPAV